MAAITTPAPTEASVRPIPRFAWAVLALAVFAWWVVTFENGQLLELVGAKAAAGNNYLHELFHDARHLLGVPCH